MNAAMKMATDIGRFRGAGKDLHDIVLAGSRLGIPVSTDLAERCASNYEVAAKSVDNFLDRAIESFHQQAEIALDDEHHDSPAPRG